MVEKARPGMALIPAKRLLRGFVRSVFSDPRTIHLMTLKVIRSEKLAQSSAMAASHLYINPEEFHHGYPPNPIHTA